MIKTKTKSLESPPNLAKALRANILYITGVLAKICREMVEKRTLTVMDSPPGFALLKSTDWHVFVMRTPQRSYLIGRVSKSIYR